MAEKNRFSKLLKHLLSVAEVKNYTLAQELQYDVSYISKWTSGQMIPSEKMEKKILEGISECVVNGCGENTVAKLLGDYQVDTPEELKLAIFDNLEAEYFYVKDLQDNAGVDVAPKTFYLPELTLPQYIAKMRHPVLRRVNALEIVGVFDIFTMEREYQLQLTQIENEHVPKGKRYPDVHFSMLIDIQKEKWDYAYDTIFLIYLLAKNLCIDFRLYGGCQAAGRAVFVVKDDYAISGMLIGRDHCICVVVSEETENCNILYRNLTALCNREKLLFRKTTMTEMLLKHDYIHAMLSLKLKWLIGHLTEHFIPGDVFEEIVQMLLDEGEKSILKPEELRNIHQMTKKIIEESEIRIMIYKTAFYNLVVDKEIVFYNRKVRLNMSQQRRCLKYFLELCVKHPNLDIKLISGKLIPDIEYSDRYCIFLSDTVSYLRLDGENNNLFFINRSDMREIFSKTFETFWNSQDDVIISDKKEIVENVKHVMQGVFGDFGTGGEEQGNSK